jgi:hypothetical protein
MSIHFASSVGITILLAKQSHRLVLVDHFRRMAEQLGPIQLTETLIPAIFIMYAKPKDSIKLTGDEHQMGSLW